MPSLRSVLKPSPAIVLSAAALLFAAGTGTGLAATTAHSAPGNSPVASGTTIRWHRLPLGKGWHGSLKYAVSNGVVYLAGIAGKNGPTSVMTTLPSGATPATTQRLPIATGGAFDGVILLFNQGSILPFDSNHDYTVVSLSGVSFALGS